MLINNSLMIHKLKQQLFVISPRIYQKAIIIEQWIIRLQDQNLSHHLRCLLCSLFIKQEVAPSPVIY